MGWLLYSLGLVKRGLTIALVFAPTIIGAYVLGLSHGPKGVAFAYSAVMVAWVIPFIAWCVKGTVVSFRDVALSVSRPLASGVLAGSVAFLVRLFCGHWLSPLSRLALESSVLFVAFFAILLFAMGQRSMYLDLVKGLRDSSVAEEKSLVSA
jgi:hypothetical protein